MVGFLFFYQLVFVPATPTCKFFLPVYSESAPWLAGCGRVKFVKGLVPDSVESGSDIGPLTLSIAWREMQVSTTTRHRLGFDAAPCVPPVAGVTSMSPRCGGIPTSIFRASEKAASNDHPQFSSLDFSDRRIPADTLSVIGTNGSAALVVSDLFWGTYRLVIGTGGRPVNGRKAPANESAASRPPPWTDLFCAAHGPWKVTSLVKPNQISRNQRSLKHAPSVYLF